MFQPRPKVPRKIVRTHASSHQRKRRRNPLRASRIATVHASTLEQSSRDLPMVTAQLIEAACRAREGDSHGAREHVTRAIEVLEGHPGPEIARQAGDRDSRKIVRGGFAAWQSQRLAAHVDANLACKFVIKELAASLYMSVGHFCRAFKRTFGMPARIWIRQRRIEFARGLMLTTRASLSEIALSCGMSDQSISPARSGASSARRHLPGDRHGIQANTRIATR
jgi:AraC family transcriptional regulator